MPDALDASPWLGERVVARIGLFACGLVMLSTLGATRPCRAQAGGGPVLQPPVLTAFVEAVYPSGAATSGREGVVVLALTIDRTGAVVDARVVQPAGYGFDEAARAAALQFRFTPALRDGVPVSARISYHYHYQFEQRGAAAEGEASRPGTASGTSPALAVALSVALPSIPQPEATPATPSPAALNVTVEGAAPSPLPIEAVGRVALRRANANNVADVLQRLPGITTEGPHNQRDRNQFVSIRGLPPEYTLVLVDGQRTASEGRGRVNLSTLPVEGVELIEVIRGPQAVIFGADAIGGVVNVLTRPLDDGPDRLLLDAGYGAFQTAHAAAAARLSGARGGLRATARHEDSEGWTDAWDLDRNLRQRFARSDARPTAKTFGGVGGTLRYGDQQALDLDLRGTWEEREQQSLRALYTAAGTRRGTEARFDGQASLLWSAQMGAELSARSGLSYARAHRHQRSTEDVLLRSAGRDVGSELTTRSEDVVDEVFSWQSRADLRPHPDVTLITLLEARHLARASDDDTRRQTYDPSGILLGDADFPVPQRIFDKSESLLTSAAQLEWRFAPAWGLAAGARVEGHQTWGWFLAPAATLAFYATPRTKLHYSVGRGYKMPSFESQTRSEVPVFDALALLWRAGNPNLRPERSLSQELGADFGPEPLAGRTAPRFSSGLSLFRVDFDDRILTATELNYEDSGYALEREINVGRVTSLGLEARMGLELASSAYLGINATRLEARNESAGTRLDRTPDWTFNVLAGGVVPGAETFIATAFRFVTEQPRIGASGRVQDDSPIAAQWLLDANVRQPIGAGVSAWVELHNLLDTRWDRDNDGDTDQPPRHLFVGLTLELDERSSPAWN